MISLQNIITPLLIVCLFAIVSCSMTKYVPEGDKMYLGANIKLTDSTSNKKQKKADSYIKAELKKVAKPVPNTSILGVRYRVMFYNMFKEPKKPKGIAYDIKHKLGRPPVLLSQARPQLTSKKMEDQLFSIGFLVPVVHSEIKAKEKTATIDYIANPGTRYTIRNIIWPTDTSRLNLLIREDSSNSLLKKNDFFDLNIFRLERERIDHYLKDSGYYYFSPENLLFKIDSLHQGQADLYIKLKDNIDSQSLHPWSFGNITVYANYSLRRDSLLNATKPVSYKGINIIDPRETYTKQLLRRVIVIHKDQMYQRNLHSLTIERLMNLNTLKFAKIDFNPDSSDYTMDTRIYLTPAKRRLLRLELSGNTKSNNFIGSEITLNYKNINLFKGAEILEAKINAGFDLQVGGGDLQSSDAYTLRGELSLHAPKMIIPFAKVTFPGSSYLPRTLFTSSIEFLRRQSLYTLRSINLGMGYYWKHGKATEHSVRVLSLTAISPSNITPTFDSILAKDPALRASFEKQLMINTFYEYKFNNTYRFSKPFNYAVNFRASTSGNVASLFSHPAVDTPNARKLFGLPISQFFRLELDVRGYYKLSDQLTWANRIIGGMAWAYGNSIAVPYSQQFFIGGSSSLRAFRARTLGPGSYHTAKSVYESNQSGEIKAEVNSELRISLSNYFKLATFVDAGNIWLRNDAPGEPGSGLDKGDLFKEMAVGGGIGLRIDASFLIIRFDVAMPFRKPWYPEKERWVFDQIDFGSKEWRKENLILNIGIGYPF